jgi:ribosome-binding factor A
LLALGINLDAEGNTSNQSMAMLCMQDDHAAARVYFTSRGTADEMQTASTQLQSVATATVHPY